MRSHNQQRNRATGVKFKTLHLSIFFFFLLFFINSSSSSSSSSSDTHSFIYGGCSQEKYTTNSPFESNRDSLLSAVVTASSEASFNSFAVGNGSSSGDPTAVFGLYQCRGDLKTADCSKCVQNGVDQITLLCPYSYGASLQLAGCYLRYENVDFLGKQDTSLRYKKCSSKSVDNDYEFFKRRDDVLADLETAVGFKVSMSGLVEGFAQCVGDLTQSDCTTCLADAVGKLKNLCGSAAAAEVFLAQCYARYWGSGYYDFSSDPTNGDHAGKSIAIIVGVIAGFAILVILLSLCRKSMH
ncbi:PREDICTED: cysteine-rich repeat secretory protein 15 [Tarenaya hassleriana]|uniref:cysteine-rich repeat secretory protein 15 n=1 Tax=Tarenaya hassleriana TaxID=28532 RepID=UPI00053C8FC4|nr:PREDICTED: cysteine-rich repeat secretory protein 15 [Tarenaya hassleriana]